MAGLVVIVAAVCIALVAFALWLSVLVRRDRRERYHVPSGRLSEMPSAAADEDFAEPDALGFVQAWLDTQWEQRYH